MMFEKYESQRIRMVGESSPDGFWPGVVNLIYDGHIEANNICGSLLSPRQKNDTRGHMRRAIIDSRLLELNGAFGGRVSAFEEPNDAGTQYHTRVTLDGKVTFTVSAVPDHWDVPRLALYRNGLVIRSDQTLLSFVEVPPDSTPNDGLLYMQLIHGPCDETSYPLPGFILLKFPKPPDCSKYYEDRIDLRKECSDTVDERTQPYFEPEVIPDDAKPQLRTDDVLPELRKDIRDDKGKQNQGGSG